MTHTVSNAGSLLGIISKQLFNPKVLEFLHQVVDFILPEPRHRFTVKSVS